MKYTFEEVAEMAKERPSQAFRLACVYYGKLTSEEKHVEARRWWRLAFQISQDASLWTSGVFS